MDGRIQFQEITFKNFQSYGNYDTTIDLSKNQLTLIQGNNGGGKTTIMSAIHYALFNKPLTKILKSSLINNKNKKGLFVRLLFKVNNDSYIIERGMKPDILNLFKNGNLVDIQGDSRDFQNNFEDNILRLNSKSFTKLICLGYDYIKFFELTSPERREFIESILDLNILSDMVIKIKEYSKSDSDDAMQLNGLISIKNSEIKIYNEQLEEAKQNNDKLILEYESSVEKYEKDNININNDIKNLMEARSSIVEHRNEVDAIIKNKKTQSENFQSLYSVGLSKIKDKTNELEFFNHSLSCPTCGRDIDKDFANKKITELKSMIAKLNNKVNEAKLNGDKLQSEINNFVNTYNSYTDDIKKIDIDLSNNNNNLNNNYKWIREYQTKLNNIKNDNDIKTAENNINRINKELDELRVKINKLTKNLENYKKCLNILSETGVKKSIIDKYIEILKTLVNNYLDKFDFPFSFDMDNEFNETLLQDFREPVTYNNLSAGEKSRVDISMLLTWRDIASLRNSISTNLLMIDEIFDSFLDDASTLQLIDILKSQEKINIFVISHKDVINNFDNIIKVKKERFGFSSIGFSR